MLTIEVRVNGSIISALTVLNRGPVPKKLGWYFYEYQGISFPASHSGPPRLWNGSLIHDREKGAEVLLKRLYSAITKHSG